MVDQPASDGSEVVKESAIEVVAEWQLPPEAHLTESIRTFLLVTMQQLAAGDAANGIPPVAARDLTTGMAELAIHPIVVALGRLETDLADARRRIEELEDALGRRDGHGR